MAHLDAGAKLALFAFIVLVVGAGGFFGFMAFAPDHRMDPYKDVEDKYRAVLRAHLEHKRETTPGAAFNGKVLLYQRSKTSDAGDDAELDWDQGKLPARHRAENGAEVAALLFRDGRIESYLLVDAKSGELIAQKFVPIEKEFHSFDSVVQWLDELHAGTGPSADGEPPGPPSDDEQDAGSESSER